MKQFNKPLAQQKPIPAYANDTTGYWSAIARQDVTSGLRSLVPSGTLFQADNAVKSRLLSAQIEWVPVQARFKNANITASLSDAQFFLALESGGDTQQGRLTVMVNKLQFNTGFPSYSDTFQIQAGGKWHSFTVAELIGQFDDNDPSLTLYLEIDQNDSGY